MKNLLELRTSQKLGVDRIIKAVLLDVGSPPPSEPDKQPITLCLPPGDVKMGCNLIGKHLHIDPREKGNVIWITCKKDGAAYLSYFEDEKKHFLTIRDGVQIHFRPLSPDVKMHNPKDRLPYLAEHYRACWDEVVRVMRDAEAYGGHIDVTAMATALWIETKAGVVVPPPQVTPSEPEPEVATPEPDKSESEPDKSPEPTPETPPGKPAEEEQIVREAEIQKHYDKYLKMDHGKLCETARKAMIYCGYNADALNRRDALIRVIDNHVNTNKEPKAWHDVFDEIWQAADEKTKKILDDAVAHAFERKPDIAPSAAHKIACIMYKELTQAEKPI